MSNILMIIAIIETILVVMFANNNASNILNLNINYTDISVTTGFFGICILIYTLGITAGVLIMFKGIFLSSKRANSAKRMLEKQSISADDSELQIRALENKIKTLETALDKALNKNN